jgi:hypothetical protein
VPKREGLQSEPGELVSAQDYQSLLTAGAATTTTTTTVPPAAPSPPAPAPATTLAAG